MIFLTKENVSLFDVGFVFHEKKYSVYVYFLRTCCGFYDDDGDDRLTIPR